jgi:hypothetical protein
MYQEVVDHCLINERAMLVDALSNNTMPPQEALMRSSVFNMLNTRYFIVNPNAEPLKNPYALGNAWFVKTYQIVENADAEIAALNDFRPDSIAIIDKRFEANLKGFVPSGTGMPVISLESYSPDRLKYRYSSSSDELAVFSEIYYPEGWNAYVDGIKTIHFRANYILRAMILPAGDHQLEFRFEPRSYYTGQNISLIASLMLILLTIGSLAYPYITRRSKIQAE